MNKLTLLLFLLLSIISNHYINANLIENKDYNNSVCCEELLKRIENLEKKLISFNQPKVNHDEMIQIFEEKIKKYGLGVSSISIGDQWTIGPEQPGEQYLVFRHKTYNQVFGDHRFAYNGLKNFNA